LSIAGVDGPTKGDFAYPITSCTICLSVQFEGEITVVGTSILSIKLIRKQKLHHSKKVPNWQEHVLPFFEVYDDLQVQLSKGRAEQASRRAGGLVWMMTASLSPIPIPIPMMGTL
jgi:hypothetical protein